jgi:hypothetical protein
MKSPIIWPQSLISRYHLHLNAHALVLWIPTLISALKREYFGQDLMMSRLEDKMNVV